MQTCGNFFFFFLFPKKKKKKNWINFVQTAYVGISSLLFVPQAKRSQPAGHFALSRARFLRACFVFCARLLWLGLVVLGPVLNFFFFLNDQEKYDIYFLKSGICTYTVEKKIRNA